MALGVPPASVSFTGGTSAVHRHGIIISMRLSLIVVLLLLLCAALTGCRTTSEAVSQPPPLPFGEEWQAVAPHMAVRVLTWKSAPVVVVRADIASCTIAVVDAHGGVLGAAAEAQMIVPTPGAAINAGFYADDANRTPLGLVVANSKRSSKQLKDDKWGIFYLRRGRAAIVPGATRLGAGITQAVQCKPRLVIDGAIPSFKPQGVSRRSAVGLDDHGHFYLVATDSYLSLEDWAACLHDALDCRNALNLDGGPSTQLSLRGNITYDMPGARMPVFLTVAPRK